MVNLTRHWHAHCMYFNPSPIICVIHVTFSQLAPKPPQPQVSNAAQQPRLIVPALPSSIPQITGTGATGNIQFPHGVISGGVVYLPQVWELSTRFTFQSEKFIVSAYHIEISVKNFCQMVLLLFFLAPKRGTGLSCTIYKILANFLLSLDMKPGTSNPNKRYWKFQSFR